jgi:hypothetical protein
VRAEAEVAAKAWPNNALEPTPYSLRFASASGRGSPRAFDHKHKSRGEKAKKDNAYISCIVNRMIGS